MTRDPHRENAELRQRLRDTEVRLRLLAGAVAAGDPGAAALARTLLAARLSGDGVSPWPPSTSVGEPEARPPSHKE